MGANGTKWGAKESYGGQGTQWGPKEPSRDPVGTREPNGGQWNPMGGQGTL